MDIIGVSTHSSEPHTDVMCWYICMYVDTYMYGIILQILYM